MEPLLSVEKLEKFTVGVVLALFVLGLTSCYPVRSTVQGDYTYSQPYYYYEDYPYPYYYYDHYYGPFYVYPRIYGYYYYPGYSYRRYPYYFPTVPGPGRRMIR